MRWTLALFAILLLVPTITAAAYTRPTPQRHERQVPTPPAPGRVPQRRAGDPPAPMLVMEPPPAKPSLLSLIMRAFGGH